MAWLRRGLPWIALGVLVLWTARGLGPSRAAAFPIGAELPGVSGALADGTHLAIGSSEQVVVLNFWASYCAPCRSEAPVLSALQAQGTDVKVIGLSVEAVSPAQAAAQARAIGMRYAVGVADEATLSRLRVQSVPTTYVISKSGKIVLSRVGVVSSGELDQALRAGRDAS